MKKLKKKKIVSLRLRLVRVKAFPKNIPFSGNTIFQKGKCIQVFGCLEIRFTENQFRCLVCTNILRKMTSVAVFGSCKSISGKYSIFRKCYFSEGKMFSCVWLHFKKFSEKYFLVFGKEEGKDKPRKTRTKPRKKNHQRSTLDWVRWRGASRAPVRRPRRRSRSMARSHEGEIVIFARSRLTSRDHDLREIAIDVARSRSTAWSSEASIAISRSTASIAIDAVLREIVISDRGRQIGAREIRADWSSGFADDRRTGLELDLLPLARSLSLSLSLFPEILWSENESVKWFL